ncbi:hypothetical protein [Gallaecimonas xiamenensis]|uniref:Lipoprotein n=1 Tax=Gallaecimonas xiamenensis 3-C-1 TaxID=745411 RepID=K2JXV6_9GAMM|nr:hypothetical protein [Gallaecimonas xiamenensis]EKE75134.1 hypothetical protein B3C1_07656 [Gallaecimonas xiamenensis 3-C-1]
MNKREWAGCLCLATLLTACGGSDGDNSPTTSNPPPTPAPVVNVGVFVDSPVAGIGYRTASQEGTTNSAGEFDYVEGESVTFFLGDLAFPAVPASGQVTPADIADGDDTTATNILQLLQTLDSDGNPYNGIDISPDMAAAFAGTTLDLASASFDTEVASVLASIDPALTLVSESAAKGHFQDSLQSQLRGSWLFSEGEGKRNVMTFLEDGLYIMIHEHADEPDEANGQTAGSVEFGEYDWDPESGELTVVAIAESDGWGGLYDPEEGSSVSTLMLDGDSFQMQFTDDAGDLITFTRIEDDQDPLVGAWLLYEYEDNNFNVLTFLPGGEYVIAHSNNQEDEPLSGEFGTYSLADGVLMVTGASVNSDGAGGLYNAEDGSDQFNEFLQRHPWGELTFTDDNEGSFGFARIGIFSAELFSDDKAATKRVQVERFRGFDDNSALGDWTLSLPALTDESSAVEARLVLNGNGVGTLTLGEESAQDISWYVTSSATLNLVAEGDSQTWYWTLTGIRGADGAVLVSLADPDDADNPASFLLEGTLVPRLP